MSRPPTSNDKSVESLLASARALPQQPEAVRARALARARAAASAPLPALDLDAPRAHWPRRLVVPAAAAAVVSGLVGSVFALGGYWSRARDAGATPVTAGPIQPAPAPSALSPLAASRAPVAPPAAPEAVPAPEANPRLHVTRGGPNAPRDAEPPSYAAELELMRSAHVAYARHDFTSALLLAGEHARRFPGGLLTEEREALRVRSLVGAGRLAEARRAAAAFASRFPRSVLVHRLQNEVGPSGD